MLTIRGVRLSGTVYRNNSVPLFVDDGDSVPKRRTWISARIDRSGWSPEHDRGLFDAMPSRSESRTTDRTATSPIPVHEAKKPRQRDAHRQFTEAEISAHPTHGFFRIVKIYEVEGTDSGRQIKRVLARCEGGRCDGKLSRFDFARWMEPNERLGCPRCCSVAKHEARRERMRAETRQSHGKYVFVGFAPEEQGKSKVRVIGRCSAGRCSGTERVFTWALWQNPDGEGQECIVCSAPERGRLAAIGGANSMLAKLDAAAAEMRARENAA